MPDIVNRLRALIVDDEPLARERLRSMLVTETSVEIVGECGNGTEALAMIKGTPLDLVFLDMQMPGCDGLQVLAEIPAESRPGIIFVTAHERYAVEAFEEQAIDYLLKPFDRERLQTALRRARRRSARSISAGTFRTVYCMQAILACVVGMSRWRRRPRRLTTRALRPSSSR